MNYNRVFLAGNLTRDPEVGAYFPDNAEQNFGDAFESAKSAALRRCAKEFGIGLQAWKEDWRLGWLKRNPERVKQSQQKQWERTALPEQASGGTTQTATVASRADSVRKESKERGHASPAQDARNTVSPAAQRIDPGHPANQSSDDYEPLEGEIVEPDAQQYKMPPMKTGVDLEREVNAQLDNSSESIEVVSVGKQPNGQFRIAGKNGKDYYTKLKGTAQKAMRAKQQNQKFIVTQDCIVDGGA